MSIRVQTSVWEADLPATTKTVLLKLADHGNDEGHNIYPSVGSLAKACGRGKRTVQRALRDLEQRGVIVLLGGGAGGRGFTRRYRIDKARLRQLSHEKDGRKGDNVTPFPALKGDIDDRKGDIDDVKGVTVAPEPSITIKEPSDSVGFEEFWQAYPSRHPHPNPKFPALEKYRAAIKKGANATEIINGTKNYAGYVVLNEIEPKFIAQAKTWLNQQRWKDHQEAPAPALATNPQARDLGAIAESW